MHPRPLDLSETYVALTAWPNRRARRAALRWLQRLPDGDTKAALAHALAAAPRLYPAGS